MQIDLHKDTSFLEMRYAALQENTNQPTRTAHDSER